MNEEKSISVGTVVAAFAGGALLGAGLALLFAPQSGRKSRRQLSDLAEDVEGKAEELAEEAAQKLKKARQKGEQWLEQATEYVIDKKAEVAAAMDGKSR